MSRKNSMSNQKHVSHLWVLVYRNKACLIWNFDLNMLTQKMNSQKSMFIFKFRVRHALHRK